MWTFGSPLANSAWGAGLALLGRASLEVFAAHVFFCFVFLGIWPADGHSAPWQDAITLAVTLASLFWVANRVRRRRADGAGGRRRAAWCDPNGW